MSVNIGQKRLYIPAYLPLGLSGVIETCYPKP